MEYNFSRRTNSRPANQLISCRLCNPNVRYPVYKNSSLIPAPFQMSAAHTVTVLYFLKIFLSSMLRSLSGLFLSGLGLFQQHVLIIQPEWDARKWFWKTRIRKEAITSCCTPLTNGVLSQNKIVPMMLNNHYYISLMVAVLSLWTPQSYNWKKNYMKRGVPIKYLLL
jgi:hypothetical protein